MMTSMFRKSLLDLVKGLRSNKEDESAFINQCLSEIKEEVRDRDHDIKANAVQKLCYLYMIGYDISFAHFNIVEVMSQPSFVHKRIGYLAASLAFSEQTDVILLTTHLFKKSFGQSSAGNDLRLLEGLPYESGCALNCLANICTPYLAETLLEDVYGMMNSAKPYVRKKAVLVLYSIFRKFPRALRLSFDRLKDKLKDENTGVQNAAVNVVCELARKNPSNYLALLPQLFELLNNSNNNWMLIKLVKLLGSLIPAEPRLAKKLQEPLMHIISTTPAKSLLYECINTAANCEVMSKAMVRLCLEKLRTFVEDPDQNLKYLGLLGLNKIMKQNPRAVAESRDLILQCLDDPDVTIRMRALDLIMSMVTEKNLEAIIQRLTDHLYSTDGSYRDHVLEQIIKVCSKEDYEFVRDFAWYVQLLTNMTHLQSMSRRNAELVAEQLIDVTLRVPEVREFAAQQMEVLIVNNGLIGDSHNMQSNAICRVLRAAAYIVGEFSSLVKDHLTLVKAMLQSRIASLPGDIQGLFIHNALKVLGSGLLVILTEEETTDAKHADKNQVCKDLITGSIQSLEPLASSQYIEVQERATAYLYFLKWLGPMVETLPRKDQKELAGAFAQVFSSELAPVHAKNQGIVAKKLPAGLSLDEWIGEQWPESEREDDDMENISDADPDDWFPTEQKTKMSAEEKEEAAQRRAQKKKQREGDPFLLQTSDQENNDTRDDEYGENHRITTEEIDKIPVKVGEETLGVHVEKKSILPIKSGKKPKKRPQVLRAPKASKYDVEAEEKDVADVGFEDDDPLKKAIDWSKPIDEEMPHLHPYKRDDSNVQAIVQKYAEAQKQAEKNAQEMKLAKKSKGKGKKKKSTDATDDTAATKSAKGKKKKSHKKTKENKNIEENGNEKTTTSAPVEHDLFEDLFGNLSQPTTTTTTASATSTNAQTTEKQMNGKSKSKEKSSKKSGKKKSEKQNKEPTEEKNEIDPNDPLGMFDAFENNQVNEPTTSSKDKKKSTKSDKSKDKKSKSKKAPKKIKKEKSKVEK